MPHHFDDTEDWWENEGGHTVNPKLYKSKTWLYRKYVVERLTEQEIAKLADTTQATINRWLEKHKLKKRR